MSSFEDPIVISEQITEIGPRRPVRTPFRAWGTTMEPLIYKVTNLGEGLLADFDCRQIGAL